MNRIISIIILFSIVSPTWVLAKGDNSITPPESKVNIVEHTQTGAAIFLSPASRKPLNVLNKQMVSANDENRGLAMLDVYGKYFGITNPRGQLQEKKQYISYLGKSSVRYQQVHEGIPIVAGEIIVNMTDDGRLISINGEISPYLNIGTKPKLIMQQARILGIQAIAKFYGLNNNDLDSTDPDLWIFDERLLRESTRPPELVWRMEISSKTGGPINEFVLINAGTGGVSLHFNQIDTGEPNEIISATNTVPSTPTITIGPFISNGIQVSGSRSTFTMNNRSNENSLPGILLCDESSNPCTGGSDAHADAAHMYTGHAHNFFLMYHGRDSFDNAGTTIKSSVHYGSGVANAYWNGTQLLFGDAYGYPMADDVVAHEFTHGVTDYTSNLFYYYQSGAINESLSDVWGEFVDLTNGVGLDTATDRWLIGEDVVGTTPLRDMEDPENYGDPNRMSSNFYYLGANDNGGVHVNSGVNNKAVFLMTDGGEFRGYVVRGLGITKIAAIYYEAQTSYLTSGSDYKDLYYSVYQACLNIVGGGEGITIEDCVEVQKALNAVEMNVDPFTNYNPEAIVCEAGESVNQYFYDDFEDGILDWEVGDFESGGIYWVWGNGYAANGTKMLWGKDYSGIIDSYSQMKNYVTIPAMVSVYLHFNHAFGFEDPNWDGGFLEYKIEGIDGWNDIATLFDSGKTYNGNINNTSNNPNPNRAAFVGDSHGYVSSRYDLSSLAEKSVKFRWRISTDDVYYDLGWMVDDVRIYACEIISSYPGKPELTSPTGVITDQTPAYQWDDVGNANQYLLVVKDSDQKVVTWLWKNAADICSAGTCLTNPGKKLGAGNYSWWVIGRNNDGDGAWSTTGSFTIEGTPAQPSLNSPNGTIIDQTPSYSWIDVYSAENYLLVVKETGTDVVTWLWKNASEICSAGTCTVDPGKLLGAESYTWWVLPKNATGNGFWSLRGDFTIEGTPTQPELYNPTGAIVDDTPEFSWEHVYSATQYVLVVKDSLNNVEEWTTYNVADICDGSTCAIIPSGFVLEPDSYIWHVLPKNSYGNGFWSLKGDFITE